MIRKGILGAAALATTSTLSASTTNREQDYQSTANLPLAGKTAFITGGARGIGLAIAEEIARSGANIVLFDIASGSIPHVGYAVATASDLQSAKAKIESLNVKCLAIKGDVREKSDLDKAMERAVNRFGSLDIIVANAAVTQVGSIEEFSAEELDVVYDINVTGVLKTTQAAAPIMKRQKSGKMIFIASALGRMGNELFPVYASSKWAVIGVAKSAALTYGRDNILCNVVSPGLVRTKFADNPYVLGKMMPNDPSPTFDKVSEMLRPGNPIDVGHLEPEDVAKAAMIFATDSHLKVTAEVFDVSYGSLARSIA